VASAFSVVEICSSPDLKEDAMKATRILQRRLSLSLAFAIGIAIVPAVTSAQGLRQYYDTTWRYNQGYG
jgi:hypothetical protein